MPKSDLSFTMPKTKGEIKKRLTQLYQLRKELRENLTNTRKELRENLTNTRNALKDIDNLVDLLTSQLENMEKGDKEMNHFLFSIDNNGEFKDIRKLNEDVLLTKEHYEELSEGNKKWREIEETYGKEHYEFCKLKVRYWQENLFKFEGGTPIDWSCFHITRFLHDYLKEHNVDKNASLTEKRIHTIAFAHALEDKLLDYIEKLEEFNND